MNSVLHMNVSFRKSRKSCSLYAMPWATNAVLAHKDVALHPSEYKSFILLRWMERSIEKHDYKGFLPHYITAPRIGTQIHSGVWFVQIFCVVDNNFKKETYSAWLLIVVRVELTACIDTICCVYRPIDLDIFILDIRASIAFLFLHHFQKILQLINTNTFLWAHSWNYSS